MNLGTYLQPGGIELLNLSGSLVFLPYAEVKTVCFVKEFVPPDPDEKRLFSTRPKSSGLWVRMRFKDNDQLDGLLANNLLALDAHGYSVTPPDPSSNTQKVFVPRQALAELQVLAVVGSPRHLPKSKVKPASSGQIGLFD